jgi:NAD(P)-dependent dehydrogenase (short-subunit alcohol dehydrogenase family)
MPELNNKVILVTGGTQGVGESVARHCLAAGASGVVICGRQQARGEALVAEWQAAGHRAEFVRADLASVDDCRRVVTRCDEVFGRVDGLVNAAADTRRGTLDSTSPELFDQLFAVNVRGPFFLMQECVRIMRREKIPGAIVNILSVAAHCGMPNLAAYSATKGALKTLTKNVANAHRADRIRVNGINLGWTDTPAEHVVQDQQGSPDDWLQRAETKSPFGRLLKPDDAAKLCLYLLSDDSGILTGSTIDFCQRVVGFLPPEM